MKKTLKMRVVDWWSPDTQENFYNNMFIKFLMRKYDVVYAKDPDFLLYGPFGYDHLCYDCVRIFITGENVRTDWSIADYGIDFDYMDFGDRHLRIPLYFWTSTRVQDAPSKHTQEFCTYFYGRKREDSLSSREKFCAFMASNGGGKYTQVRERFLTLLNEYKRVDSGGRWNNNIGAPIGDRYNDFQTSKREWLKGYKFHICFENASYPGYVTEKLFDAYAAGCVPIYWGDTSLRCAYPPPLLERITHQCFQTLTQ